MEFFGPFRPKTRAFGSKQVQVRSSSSVMAVDEFPMLPECGPFSFLKHFDLKIGQLLVHFDPKF